VAPTRELFLVCGGEGGADLLFGEVGEALVELCQLSA
jgi:hypothetical protein